MLAAVGCGIRADELYCWGADTSASPARGLGESSEPRRGGELNTWRQVALGRQQGCGLLDDRTLHCWGDSRLVGLESDGELVVSVEQRALARRPTGHGWAQESPHVRPARRRQRLVLGQQPLVDSYSGADVDGLGPQTLFLRVRDPQAW